MSSFPTSYLIWYCHECVRVIHVWSTNGIWNVTACSGVYMFQCFVLMWFRQQVPAEYRYGVLSVTTHAQKQDFIFQRNGRILLNRLQLSLLPAAEACASGIVMLDTTCSKVVRRVLATHFIRKFHLNFPFRASPCVILFQLDSTTTTWCYTLADHNVNTWCCENIRHLRA